MEVTEDTEQTGSMNKTIDDQTQIQIISSNDLTDLLNARQQIIKETPSNVTSAQNISPYSFSHPVMQDQKQNGNIKISQYQMDPFKYVEFPTGGFQRALNETANPNARMPRVIYKHANNFHQ